MLQWSVSPSAHGGFKLNTSVFSLFLTVPLHFFPSHSIISSYTVHYLKFCLSLRLPVVLPLLRFPLSTCFPAPPLIVLLSRSPVPIFSSPSHFSQELEERLRHHHHAELQSLREAHRQSIETLKQQSEQELQTLRFELEDEGKAMLGNVFSVCAWWMCLCVWEHMWKQMNPPMTSEYILPWFRLFQSELILQFGVNTNIRMNETQTGFVQTPVQPLDLILMILA